MTFIEFSMGFRRHAYDQFSKFQGLALSIKGRDLYKICVKVLGQNDRMSLRSFERF